MKFLASKFSLWFLVLLLSESCFFFAQAKSIKKQEDGVDEDENLGLAFGLVTAAGLSTTFGAMLVYCDCIFRMKNHIILGAALGFSGGVMFYVSMVEIFQKSLEDFQNCNCLWAETTDADANASAAYVMATICFFGGVLITYMLDFFVHFVFARTGHAHNHGIIEDIQDNNDSQKIDKDKPQADDVEATIELEIPNQIDREPPSSPIAEEASTKSALDEEEQVKARKLHQMGLMTALAIGLHNFPEGLATFIATLADPSVGVGLAVAIAIHNIPEGLCVSVPVYYATGSRWRGFILSFWSGISELIGAVLGYLVLRSAFGPAAFASLFGIVSGMMVTIVLKELIPTAHRYDVADKYVTKSVFLGAFVMSLSLVLFEI